MTAPAMRETAVKAARPDWKIGLWLSAAAMFACLFVDGFAQDIDFWRTWIWQLQMDGYQALNANYPPLLLHWFRLLAWVFNTFNISPQSDLFIKSSAALPVMLSQLVLVDLVGRHLAARGEAPLRQATFWLTVFNPALLLDGPVWGQVDLLPFLPTYCAIVLATDQSRSVWAFPLFALALLCKFQAIVFAPLIAGLALRHWRAQLLGLPLAVLVIGAGFLPFALGGADVLEAMERAYWGNLGIYPYSTLNAANLWYLISGSSYQPDNVSLVPPGTLPEIMRQLATPARLGLLSFAIISLWVFVSALLRRDRAHTLGLAVLSTLGFFAFSSGMHERYLFLAVPLAALWGCQAPDRRFWYPLLTFLVYLNVNFMLSISGDFAWRALSALVVAAFVFMVLQSLMGRHLELIGRRLAATAEMVPQGPYAALALAWLALMSWQVGQLHVLKPPAVVPPGEFIYLSELAPEQYFQEWGELKRDSSLDGHPICIIRRCYDRGLATHARSVIAYRVPEGVSHFRAEAGIERQGADGKVAFSVEIDGVERWQSGAITTRTEPVTVDLPVSPGQRLLLKVDPLGPNFGDHAVWANAHFAR